MIWLGLALVLLGLAIWPFRRERTLKIMDDAARASAPGEHVALSGGITHFEWAGPPGGPVAVCIHGLTTPSFVWKGLVPVLTKMGYRVLIYDLFGRGYSDRPKGLQDKAFLLRQLEELLASQGVEDNLTVIGYSMGGAIASCYAAAHPTHVRQLVLLAPAGIRKAKLGWRAKLALRPWIGDWMMLLSYPRIHRKGTETERGLPSSVPGIVELQQSELDYQGFTPAVLSSLRGLLSTSLKAEHRAIAADHIPLLVVVGSVDPLIPPSIAGPLTAWNPAAQVRTIEGAGHGLPYTHTANVSEVLNTFLDRHAE